MNSALALLLLASPALAGKKKKPAAPVAEPAAAPAPAEPAPAAEGPLITLPCGWSAGDSWHFATERVRTRPGQPTSTTTSTVDLSVLEVDGSTTVFAWSDGKPQYDQASLDADPMLKAASELPHDDTPLELVVSQGAVSAIRNQDAYLAAFAKMVESMIATMKDAPQPVQDSVRATLSKPEMALASAVQAPNALFGALCVEMAVGEELSVPVPLPNPMGGEPMPAQLMASMPTHDPSAGTAEVTLVTVPEPAAVTAMAKQLIAQMAKEMGAPDPSSLGIPMPEIQIVSTADYTMRVADGMPDRAAIVRGTSVMGQMQEDRWIFERAEAAE